MQPRHGQTGSAGLARNSRERPECLASGPQNGRAEFLRAPRTRGAFHHHDWCYHTGTTHTAAQAGLVSRQPSHAHAEVASSPQQASHRAAFRGVTAEPPKSGADVLILARNEGSRCQSGTLGSTPLCWDRGRDTAPSVAAAAAPCGGCVWNAARPGKSARICRAARPTTRTASRSRAFTVECVSSRPTHRDEGMSGPAAPPLRLPPPRRRRPAPARGAAESW